MLRMQARLSLPFLMLLSLPSTAMGFALAVQISALSWLLSTNYNLDIHEIGIVWAAGPLAGTFADAARVRRRRRPQRRNPMLPVPELAARPRLLAERFQRPTSSPPNRPRRILFPAASLAERQNCAARRGSRCRLPWR